MALHIAQWLYPTSTVVRLLIPWPILDHPQQINLVAFKFQLPKMMKTYQVSHVSLLKDHINNSFPRWVQLLPPPINAQGHEESLVKKILDSKVHRGSSCALFDWYGYGVTYYWWELANNIHTHPNLRIPLVTHQVQGHMASIFFGGVLWRMFWAWWIIWSNSLWVLKDQLIHRQGSN